MYEKHFGLKTRPFSVKATGTEVFVGPQTAKTMAGFRKALTVQDAVVTVSGAAGTGKTTLVERALDAIGSKYKTIRVGRVQMNASDVLESLLIVLGVEDRPTGTIQRFTALRKKLKDLQDNETRVFIVVEDALRAGTDTLAELEALTVGDAGESDGASIVLMGDERLFDYMKEPALAQLQQRIRQRHRIKPLCVAELGGYLKHSLRTAGGDFDQVFGPRSAELIHELSEGIPRVANTLVDAVLVTAASQGVSQVSAELIASVASDEFGLSVEDFDFSEAQGSDSEDDEITEADSVAQARAEEATPADADAEAPPVLDAPADPTPDLDELPTLEPSLPNDGIAAAVPAEEISTPADAVAEQQPHADVAPAPADSPAPADAAEPATNSVAEPAQESGESSEPVIVFADPEQEVPDGSADIPHLIQDTLPDLAILSRRYEILAESYEGEAAAPNAEPTDAAIPELEPETPTAPVEQEIPELTPEATVAADAEPVPELSAAPVEPEIPELVPDATAVATSEDIQEPELPVVDTPEATTDRTTAAEPANDADPNWKVSEEPEFQLVDEVVPALEEEFGKQHDTSADDVPELQIDAGATDIPELAVDAGDSKPDLPDARPEPVAEVAAEAETLPELEVEQPSPAEPMPESAAEELPEWERDPTLAQLKPDLDALEQAMAFTHGDEPPVVEEKARIELEKLAAEVADPEEVPEIILDKSIETGIGNLDVEEPSDILPPTPEPKSDPELDRIAAHIANAKSLEDIDDIMAETLFGSGISMIAEQVIANPPSNDSANAELELAVETPSSPAPAANENTVPAANNSAAPRRSEITEEISIETRTPVASSSVDLSASQRLKTVRALNADLHPSLREPGNDAKAKRSPGSNAPQPIEDQINTSITQTLKALKLPPEALQDDEEDEPPKKGFLSRFRRS